MSSPVIALRRGSLAALHCNDERLNRNSTNSPEKSSGLCLRRAQVVALRCQAMVNCRLCGLETGRWTKCGHQRTDSVGSFQLREPGLHKLLVPQGNHWIKAHGAA